MSLIQQNLKYVDDKCCSLKNLHLPDGQETHSICGVLRFRIRLTEFSQGKNEWVRWV